MVRRLSHALTAPVIVFGLVPGVLVFLACAAVVALVLTACTSSDELAAPHPTGATATTGAPPAAVDLAHLKALAQESGTALCLDVGHLMLFGGDLTEFMDANLDRIREIHLHDVIKTDDRLIDHQALGTGIVPVADLVHRFAQTDGYLTVEVFGWRAFVRSMTTLTELGFLPPEGSSGG